MVTLNHDISGTAQLQPDTHNPSTPASTPNTFRPLIDSGRNWPFCLFSSFTPWRDLTIRTVSFFYFVPFFFTFFHFAAIFFVFFLLVFFSAYSLNLSCSATLSWSPALFLLLVSFFFLISFSWLFFIRVCVTTSSLRSPEPF